MKIIVISPPYPADHETQTLVELFHKGLEIFHLRKPDFSLEQTAAYIARVHEGFHDRIVLHAYHHLAETYKLRGIHFTEAGRKTGMDHIAAIRKNQPGLSISSSFHKIADIAQQGDFFDYVFLSPVFDSISKKNYRAAFDPSELGGFLKASSIPVIALGGVDASRVNTVGNLGFSGAAVLGAVWEAGDPVEAFVKIKQAAEAA